jgi:hypothetical protein
MLTEHEERHPEDPVQVQRWVRAFARDQMTSIAFKLAMRKEGVITYDEATYPDKPLLCVLLRLPGGKHVLLSENGELL